MPLRDSPQYNKQHAVPQNIMDVEFKLIGDLTMRQFFYVLIFFGIAYGIFNTGMPVLFKWPLITLLVVGGLGFAFVPIEDRGLDEWVVNFFKSIYSDSQLIWRKEPNPPSAFLYENISAIQQELVTLTPTASRRKLEQYLEDQLYGTQTDDPYDTLEQSYIMKVKEAFAGVSAPVIAPPSSPSFVTQPQPIPTTAAPLDEKPGLEFESVLKQDSPQSPPVIAAVKPVSTSKQKAPKIEIQAAENVFVQPITPDRHSGRKFTNLLPNQGTIVLPIRGERVLKSFEPQDTAQNQDSSTKAKQLKDYIEQVKGIESTSKRAEESRINEDASALIARLQKQNEELQKQIAELKAQPAKQLEVEELEKQQKETVETIGKLKEQIASLTPQSQESQLGVIPANLQPTTPNTISGIVRNFRGQGLDGTLLVIKNQKGEPVRAIKTNGLGEFSISNPLTSGAYTIETDVNGSTGFRFDIMNFEARGKIIPAIEIVGK